MKMVAGIFGLTGCLAGSQILMLATWELCFTRRSPHSKVVTEKRLAGCFFDYKEDGQEGGYYQELLVRSC